MSVGGMLEMGALLRYFRSFSIQPDSDNDKTLKLKGTSTLGRKMSSDPNGDELS